MTDTATTTTSLNKFEKFKAQKDGLAIRDEIEKFAALGWEAMDETDRDHRLKWVGVFFRPVTPGKFMMRLRMPNGILNSSQMRVLAQVVQRYGDDGCADITTRQNIQLRGIRIEDLPDIFNRFHAVGLTSIQSGMDNVRNITGDPVAGLDADELYDTRELVQQIQDMLTNKGQGNPEFSNLPRKFNIAIAGGRDNSVHAEINDLAFVPAFKEASGEWGVGNDEQSPTAYSLLSTPQKVFGFNIIVGGFFSAKRCEAAIPLNAWVLPEDVVAVCRAVLEVFRDHGSRANRQKSRLMWLIDEWGVEKFRAEVESRLGKSLLPAAAKDEIDWEKRDHIGVYKQKQAGLNYAGLNIPVGRLYAEDMFEIARLAEVYGSSEIRFTVEQNIVIPNISDSRLATFLTEPLLERFSIDPGLLTRSLVSCTGAQFCNFALIETKNRALAMIKALEEELTFTNPVRIHWTGCPNSCGQPQVADIGLMGTKTRKNGKTLEGVDIYMGGKVGKDAHLGTCIIKGIPCEDLQPVLQDLLIKNFGAKLKQEALLIRN
ncbi:MAG: ferredoxin--nitrite reductase [Nostoc sp. CmiVER01]|uniref:ferredoxin--nitrite reductase n=1 Tax=Nostoc sp. CmiVER01 TaxID=3075384 RepID=UPI002AD2F91D|nr:ferredoxin--nitrite reductase [Nostoc sp. CmiVER01]MDZ8125843.1 ferredoxin--nitrite reductase [Nostoc sp. CmiVER01]